MRSSGAAHVGFWLQRRMAAFATGRNHAAVDAQVVDSHLIAVLATGVLMWAYAILACLTIASPVPGTVGVLCSVLHLLSPLVYRLTAHRQAACSLMLAAGLVHQATFAWFTGGYLSSIVVWFGILPWLAGLIAGMRAAALWFALTIAVASVFLALHALGHPFPDLISSTGRGIAQGMILFGWISLSFVMIATYIVMRQRKEAELTARTAQAEMLFRALFHDLATPLGAATLGLANLRADAADAAGDDDAAMIERSLRAMDEIIAGVRDRYRAAPYVEAGVDLAAAVAEVAALFVAPLAAKRLSLALRDLGGQRVAAERVALIHHVLANLVGNAIKYSHPGGEIRVSATRHSDGRVVLSVADDGIGMPRAVVDTLFAAGGPAVRSGTVGEVGAGCGLQLARAYAQSFGGDLFVRARESDQQGPSGTVVEVRLRAAPLTPGH